MTNGFAQMRAGVVVQFVLLAWAWGSSFLRIKVGLNDLFPTQIVWARMVIGAVALGLLLTATRHTFQMQ